MIQLNSYIMDVVVKRYSCRTYRNEPLGKEDKEFLESIINRASSLFGTTMRFSLVMTETDNKTGKFGTYGIIKHAQGFIAGTTYDSQQGLIDFGYAVEQMILAATERMIGTCWLGGTFTKCSFSKAMGLKEKEILPAVVSVGYPDQKRAMERYIRYRAGSDNRKYAQELFFYNVYGIPIPLDYQCRELLELVRLAPSASNKQPWRIIVTQDVFHFYLARTPGYYERNKRLFGLYDLQLVDMGIALCHFHYGAQEYGINGVFTTLPHDQIDGINYIISYEKKD